MQHPLQQQVDHIRREARRVRVVHAAAWLAATLLAAGLILGLADFLLRSEEFGVRLLFSAAALGAVGWTLWRYLLPALGNDSSIAQVAQRIERCWPHLEDRLSSSLEFLAQTRDDPSAGSPALRRTVIAEATARIDGLPLAEVIDRRRPWPVLLTVGVLLLTVVLLSLAAPQTAARAARRLVMPWTQNDAWPRKHALAFVAPPDRLPYGEPFRAELIDQNGNPPELVEIYYWFDGQDPDDVRPQAMKPSGEQMVHHLTRVTRPFQYRAVGGDDDTMSWHRVDVVEPPRVASLNITLHPPKYTARASGVSSRHLHAIAGTRVTLAGTSTKPLVSARIMVETEGSEEEIALTVSENRLAFALNENEPNWILSTSGSYRLILAGNDGVESGRNDRFQMDISPDVPPRISVAAPQANSFVTADATVPIQATVSDDLAIARIELRYSRSDVSDTGEEVILLYEGPPAASPESDSTTGDVRQIDYNLELGSLAQLPPGASLLLSVAAADYRPQEELSVGRRITIITPDQLEDRIVQRQTFLLGQLAEALAIEREARSQSKAIEIQLQQTGELTAGDVVDLQSAELNQRRVGRILAGENDGVLSQIETLLEFARANRLDNPDLEQHIGRLGKAIRLITSGQLPAIDRDLLTALKDGQTAMHASEDEPIAGTEVAQVQQSVSAAGQGQERVIERLEQLLGDLSQWDSYRRFSRQVSALRRDQQTIAQRTSELRAQTLSKTTRQLTSQEKADLAKLGQRQKELARRLERMLLNMEQMQDELTDAPVASQTLGDAVELARRHGMSGRMRQVSQQIEENQLGQASARHQQLSEHLDELLDTLTGRREHQLERRLDQLSKAADELQGLQEKSQALQEKMAAAVRDSNENENEKRRKLERLEAVRQKHQEEMERLARKLQRLQAEEAAQSLSQAAEHSRQGGAAAEQRDAHRQSQQSDLEEEDLADARKNLKQQIKQIEQDLLQERLARLEQSLKTMADQQQAINDETARLETLRAQNSELTRGQLASVRTLALQQRGLMAEAADFAEQIAAAEVFHLGLTSASRRMAIAAQRLEVADTGEATQRAETAALRRLEQLVEAMQEDGTDEPPDGGEGSGSDGNQGEPSDGIKNIAQLKLLRLMQQALRERTNQLEQAGTAHQWTEQEEAEIAALADEQGRLADLLLKLSTPVEEGGQDDPEDLPDLGEGLDRELQDILDDFHIEGE